MTVTLRDAKPSAEDRAWIARCYPEYVHELSLRVSGIAEPFPVAGEHGDRQCSVGADRSAAVVAVARRWSAAMAASGALAHNPDLGAQVSSWSRIAENVGTASSTTSSTWPERA